MCYTYCCVLSPLLLSYHHHHHHHHHFIFFTDISAYTFIAHVDPSEVIVEARQLAEGEPRLLDVNRDRVVSLSPLAHDHAEGYLEANDGGGDGSGPSVVFGVVLAT